MGGLFVCEELHSQKIGDETFVSRQDAKIAKFSQPYTNVIPAKAGIHFDINMDARLRGHDGDIKRIRLGALGALGGLGVLA